MAEKEKRSAAKGLSRLVAWQMIDEPTGALPSYGEAHEFDKALMTMNFNPEVAEGGIDADDMRVEEETEQNGGELTYGLVALIAEEKKFLYGNKITENGVVVSNVNDRGAYIASAAMTKRSDGKVNLYKFFKARFLPQAESYSTKKKGSIEYATTEIKGKVIPLLFNGDFKAEKFAVDPVDDAVFIKNWFTEAIFIGDADVETLNPEDTTTSPETDPVTDNGEAAG